MYAIAFAVSLMYGLRPDKLKYNQIEMRKHLVSMFKKNKIEHFPIEKREENDIPSLQKAISD